jgi:hypothetical protein
VCKRTYPNSFAGNACSGAFAYPNRDDDSNPARHIPAADRNPYPAD